MPRPFCMRHVDVAPSATYYKPAGIPMRELAEVVVTLDELEALRLADLQGLYQEQAAERMQISRPTFARVVESARKKVADALINGKALRLEGGPVIQPPAQGARGHGHGCCGRGRHGRGCHETKGTQ